MSEGKKMTDRDRAAALMWWLVDRKNGAALDPRLAHEHLAAEFQKIREECAGVVGRFDFSYGGILRRDQFTEKDRRELAAAIMSLGRGEGRP